MNHGVELPRARHVGLLLAAGKGERFDPAGRRNKLLHALPDGERVACRSARVLLEALGSVVAVVAHGDHELAALLRKVGCEVVHAPAGERSMSTSLRQGLLAAGAPATEGWIVALADMPWVLGSTVAALRRGLEAGAGIVAPFHGPQRGHPVGFSRVHRAELMALSGDTGARTLLARHPVHAVEVDDPGILLDIDTPSDLPPPVAWNEAMSVCSVP
jgi:molybdenum cofactor cytidylyltransferase